MKPELNQLKKQCMVSLRLFTRLETKMKTFDDREVEEAGYMG